MKRFTLFSLIQLFVAVLYAQNIEVKKFEPMAKGQIAILGLRKDVDGNTGKLIKVLWEGSGAEFYGILPTRMLPKYMSVHGSPTKLVANHYQRTKCLVYVILIYSV